MRLSYLADPHGNWSTVRRLAVHAASAGYDGIWFSDHLVPEPPRVPSPLEAFSSLGALATEVSGVRLGTLVSPLTFRPAPVLASFAATLAEMTGGRFVLGVGLGGDPGDHKQTGVRPPSYDERLRAVEQGCAIIRQYLDAYPRPAPGPAPPSIPLLIGGAGARTLAVVGALADEWISYCDPAQLLASSVAIEAGAAAAGRPADAVARGAVVMLLDEDVPAAWRGDLPSPVVGLNEREDVRLLREYQNAGAAEIVVCDHRISPGRRAHALDRFIRLVEEAGT